MLFKRLLNSEVPEYAKKAAVSRDDKDTFRWKKIKTIPLFGAFWRLQSAINKVSPPNTPFFLTV